MTTKEFLTMCKEEPSNWINYCEILILQNGTILLARPSHTEAIIEYCMDKYNKTREEIAKEIPNVCDVIYFLSERENIIVVWWNEMIYPREKLNRFQQRTIDILKKENLISNNCIVYKTKEYSKHLYRKRNYGID